MTVKDSGRAGAAFRELLSLFLYTDHRLPFLEATTFLLIISSLLFGQINSGQTNADSDLGAFTFVTGYGGFSLTTIIFVVVILKNLTSGFGGEFDKGTIQTLLDYPLSRGKLLLARVLSSVLLVVALLALVDLATAAVISPSLVAHHLPMLMAGFLVAISLPFMIAAVATLLAMVTKSGGVVLAVGLTLYFGILVLSAFLVNWGYTLGNGDIVLAAFLLDPVYSFLSYFGSGPGCYYPCLIPPASLGASVVVLTANLVISVSVFGLAAYYFTRVLEV